MVERVKMVNVNYISPVDCNEHHSPDTTHTSHHANDARYFTQNWVVREKSVPIYGTKQYKYIHSHHSQIEHSQYDNEPVMKFTEVFCKDH